MQDTRAACVTNGQQRRERLAHGWRQPAAYVPAAACVSAGCVQGRTAQLLFCPASNGSAAATGATTTTCSGSRSLQIPPPTPRADTGQRWRQQCGDSPAKLYAQLGRATQAPSSGARTLTDRTIGAMSSPRPAGDGGQGLAADHVAAGEEDVDARVAAAAKLYSTDQWLQPRRCATAGSASLAPPRRAQTRARRLLLHACAAASAACLCCPPAAWCRCSWLPSRRRHAAPCALVSGLHTMLGPAPAARTPARCAACHPSPTLARCTHQRHPLHTAHTTTHTRAQATSAARASPWSACTATAPSA